MRMRVPNLLVVKPITVDAHPSRAISHRSVASLHHEACNDTMEAVALVVKLFALFARAQSPEVLTGLGHVSEELEDNAARLVALFPLSANRDIKVGLRVFGVEGWQRVVPLGDLDRLLLVVDTFCEEGCETLLLLLSLACLLLLDGFELVAKVAIGRGDLDRSLDVGHSFIKITAFHVSHAAQVKGLCGVGINLDRLRAVNDSFTVVLSIVCAD